MGTEDCRIHSVIVHSLITVIVIYVSYCTEWFIVWLVALMSLPSMEHFRCFMSVKIPPLFLLNSFSENVSRILMETRIVDRDKSRWLFQGSWIGILVMG